MYIVLLKFSDNKAKAKEYMDGHNAWIKQGFDDDVFLFVGSIEPGQGGSIIAHGESLETLEKRVGNDPFAIEGIVTAEILEISPKKTDARLNFLVD